MSLLGDLHATKLLALGEKFRRRGPRIHRGDGFRFSGKQAFGVLADRAMVSFKSILQGDHLGVELATQSHANLLKAGGLLQDSVRMVSDRPLPSLQEVQGLCIDDFLLSALSQEMRPLSSLGL
jgi:hypothetical protein